MKHLLTHKTFEAKNTKSSHINIADIIYDNRHGINSITTLIKQGANLNELTSLGDSALSICVTHYNALYSDKYYELLKLLIKHGADVNIKDSDGLTPLMRAAQKFDSLCLRELIRSGANLEIKDLDGHTALIYASTNMNSYYCLDALIEAGADLNGKNNNGKNFIDTMNQYETHFSKWLESEKNQQIIADKDPLLIKSLIKKGITIYPSVINKYPYIVSGADLNLL